MTKQLNINLLEVEDKCLVVGDCRYIIDPQTGGRVIARITSIVEGVVEGDYIVNYRPLNSKRSEFYSHHSQKTL